MRGEENQFDFKPRMVNITDTNRACYSSLDIDLSITREHI